MNTLFIKAILAVYVSTLPSTYEFTGDEAECFASQVTVDINTTSDNRCMMNSTVFVSKYGNHNESDGIVFAGSVFVEGECDDYSWLYTSKPVKCNLVTPRKSMDDGKILFSIQLGTLLWSSAFGIASGLIAILILILLNHKLDKNTAPVRQSPVPLSPPPTTTHHLAGTGATPTPAKSKETGTATPNPDENHA